MSAPGPLPRRVLLGGAAAAATGAALPAPALARGGLTLRLLTAWPAALPILPGSAERLARAIETLTEGGLRFEIRHADAHGDPYGIFDAVARGEAEAYHGAEYYWMDRHPGFAFFAAAPFGFTPGEIAAWLDFGGGLALWRELAGGFGIHPVAAGNTGSQMGGWFPRAVDSLAAVEGLRMRMPGLGGRVWQAAGAGTVDIPGPEIVAAFLEGRIDALEWIGPQLDMHFGFMKLLPVYMYPGWHEPGTLRSLGLNKALFDNLAPVVQEIVETAARSEAVLLEAQFQRANARALNIMRREYGVAPVRFPDALLAELARLADGVLEGIAAHDRTARRLAASFAAYRARVGRASETAEGAYIPRRNAALGLDAVYRYD